jgi:type VI secretion system protein ImpD
MAVEAYAPGAAPSASSTLSAGGAGDGAGAESLSELLEQIFLATPARVSAEGSGASAVRPSSGEAVRQLRELIRAAGADAEARSALELAVGHLVARIDKLVCCQVNLILHHPRFQQLEASWRGLGYLVGQVNPEDGVKVRVLNASWVELARDAERALEFDQSELFHKVYENEFGMAGGEPIGLLVGDYQIRGGPSGGHSIDDLAVLSSVSQVAAAAFAPFVASAHPSLLGLERFEELERPLNLERAFEQKEYVRWRSFRDAEDSRFVGLTLPRVLMRAPYDAEAPGLGRVVFAEETHSADCYLWGNAAYAFAGVLVRSFSQTRWPSDIRGVRRGVKPGTVEDGGGLVTGLPAIGFATDAEDVFFRGSTDVTVTDLQERTLSQLGFIPLCPCKETEYCAFYGNQSVQKPRAYSDSLATANARVSAMLQYILSASRFAHYLKVIARDKVGSFREPQELKNEISNWLVKYTLDDANAAADLKARYPLRGFEVAVRQNPAKPGVYFGDLLLLPHSQWDELSLGVRLVTELAPAGA